MWRRRRDSPTRKPWYRGASMLLAVPVFGALLLPAGSIYYRYSGGSSCATCHEIFQPYSDWHTSTHRNVRCAQCHGDVLTLDAGFHWKNIRQLAKHLRGNVPEQVRLKTDDVQKITERCRSCHQQEYADWAAGPHGITYREIFLDESHNRREHLADDCLRCHGMHYQGGIRDLVSTTDARGPWKLRDASLTHEPVIPCLTCHQLHRQGNPLVRPPLKPTAPGPSQNVSSPSLALFDRRELDYVAVTDLSLPPMREGSRVIKLSPDMRQALCYQCHAPIVTKQVNSGDDRTPVGVHEGLSCFACHQGHGQKTRASCSTCHPQLSNCGLNVEAMDTTFRSVNSPHDIHFVKCVDCHANGVPKKRVAGT